MADPNEDYEAFIFDSETGRIYAPIEEPQDGRSYFWSIDQKKWLPVEIVA
jgi:hypothetical protein